MKKNFKINFKMNKIYKIMKKDYKIDIIKKLLNILITKKMKKEINLSLRIVQNYHK